MCGHNPCCCASSYSALHVPLLRSGSVSPVTCWCVYWHIWSTRCLQSLWDGLSCGEQIHGRRCFGSFGGLQYDGLCGVWKRHKKERSGRALCWSRGLSTALTRVSIATQREVELGCLTLEDVLNSCGLEKTLLLLGKLGECTYAKTCRAALLEHIWTWLVT